MGLFGFGERDVHRALGETAPGVRWDVVRDASDSGKWHAALRKAARGKMPSLSTAQAGLLTQDIWQNLYALRNRVRIVIWAETDSGEWVGASDEGAQTLDSAPPQYT